MKTVGTRVGAILEADETTVKLGYRLDVLVASHNEAGSCGVKKAKVWILQGIKVRNNRAPKK